MSPLMTSLPRIVPSLIFCGGWGFVATSSATGLPNRVSTIGFPVRSAFSSVARQFDLNFEMGIFSIGSTSLSSTLACPENPIKVQNVGIDRRPAGPILSEVNLPPRRLRALDAHVMAVEERDDEAEQAAGESAQGDAGRQRAEGAVK